MPEGFTFALLLVIALALAFDYINGFHDTANAIATSVATRALRPHVAIAMAAAFNFIGAFSGTAVAKTIGAGLVQEGSTTQPIVAAALVGAIVWNLITWYYGIPSSSSHALVGGLVGATVAGAGSGAVKLGSLTEGGVIGKVLVPMITSPLIGFTIAFAFSILLYRAFRRVARKPASAAFRRAQVFSAGYMAFAHGSNDAQKTMGIITLALVSAGVIATPDVPVWVIVVAATAISLGTAVGGWRIMRTMGHRVVELEPVDGFAAETSAATILLATAHLGMPVSTTHVISSSIMGVGTSKGAKGVRWGVARNILAAWVITLPAAALIGAVAFAVIHIGLR